MGAVYRATDGRLNREVAIKVLPDVLSADPDYLARFHREAQVLASLNHPHIANIYGVEDKERAAKHWFDCQAEGYRIRWEKAGRP